MKIRVAAFGVLLWYFLIPGCMTGHNEAQLIAEKVLQVRGLHNTTKVPKAGPEVKSLSDYSSYLKPRLNASTTFVYASRNGEVVIIQVLSTEKYDAMALWRIYNIDGQCTSSGLYMPDLQSHEIP